MEILNYMKGFTVNIDSENKQHKFKLAIKTTHGKSTKFEWRNLDLIGLWLQKNTQKGKSFKV